ncbi:class I tRNA ligase family protein [Paraburkholderia sp. BCC1876]|uniref:class I tRNA ligase family protein n=1 Tax=Paraburkholderia sp. BCC1876 TaxID=2676303 RepID=UPI0015904348|nr:class I tRNA ligase family protein [Paraburkholderia sp. BCC1876]
MVIHVIAPPPTPNGDLHVGHLSGPYLAADIYSRCLRQSGATVSYVISTDDHQSYVDTSATRLETTPAQLIARSRAEIRATLDSFSIELTRFAAIDPAYVDFVEDFFRTLLVREKIEVRSTAVLYDRVSARYAVEAFVSGFCRTCLARSSGGICEACGHPNRCIDLLDVDSERFAVLHEPRLILDLERYRSRLEVRLLGMTTHRPWLGNLIRSLLANELPPFVLSYKTGRGVDTAFAGLGDQKLNVWGEMFPGHMYFLQQASGALSSRDGYIQFLGFDNSYFYAIVHVALSIAAEEAGFDWPKPGAFVTNQFYNLDNAKFSTSKGHLVWARPLAEEFNSDLIRLYLAIHGPEYQEANFSKDSFHATAIQLAGDINRLVCGFNDIADLSAKADDVAAATLAAAARPLTGLDRYSSSDAARRAMNCIRFLGERISAGDLGLAAYVPGLLALCLEPFCPRYSQAIRHGFGMASTNWDRLAPVGLSGTLPGIEIKAGSPA